MIMIEILVERWLAGETEVLGENLPQGRFVHHKPHFIFLLLFGLWGYWHHGHSWPIVPASGDSEDDCGEADGM
jgi:hypothetical protein